MMANTLDPQNLPLKGIKVLEFGQNIAGPYASAILGALGADVLKVERPGTGDDARGWGPPFWKGTATTFQAMNHGKRSVEIDLKDPVQRDRIVHYAAQCDVVIQNLRPGTVEQLGLDAGTLRAANPRLIYCSLHAFGHLGPMRHKPGYEPVLQAFSGMFSVNGPEDCNGARVGMQVLDLGTGVWAALGCLAALFQRHTSGQGAVVDTSLLETALGWLQVLMAGFQASGEQPRRHRSGNPAVVVFQAFATEDGEILVSAANDRLFNKLARVLGHGEWTTNPRYASNALRVQHKAELLPRIEAAFTRQTTAHWMSQLEHAGIPCSPIHDFAQALAEPQVQALGILQPVPALDLEIIGLPLSLDGCRPPIRARAPELGQHNADLAD